VDQQGLTEPSYQSKGASHRSGILTDSIKPNISGTLYIVYGTCSDENFVRVPIRGRFEARLVDPMENDLMGSENPVQ